MNENRPLDRVEFSPKVRPPVTRNDRHTIRGNSISIQNAGNVVMRIDDEWTINPGGGFEFGSHTDENIIVHEMHVSFIDDPLGNWKNPGEVGAVQRCEIVEIHIHDRITAHYSEKASR